MAETRRGDRGVEGATPVAARTAPRVARLGMPTSPPPGLPEAALWGLFSAFGLLVALGLALRLPDAPVRSCLAAAGALVCGLALLRVPAGRGVFLMAPAAAGVAIIGNATASNVGWFAICVLGLWCALTERRSHSIAYLAGAVALFGAEALWAERDAGWAAWAVGTALSVSAALLVRHNLALVAELRTAQAGLADRTRAEERNRIARELHDVIGHSLTVVLLHLASARMALKYAPADAENALLEAERLGRQTLDEVRATVGMLRVDGEEPSVTSPLPSLADIETLVRRFREAGADISYSFDGDLGATPATAGLAAYRIAQEALTNAVKHAPGLSVDLSLRVERDSLELVVRNDFRLDGVRPSQSSGIGLVNMQERAEAVGGTFAVTSTGEAWEVRAVLPFRPGGKAGGFL